MITTVTASLMSVLLLDTNLQAALPNPDLDVLTSSHAPSEESPLLQLMEAYSGLAILATNLKQALDVACIEERA